MEELTDFRQKKIGITKVDIIHFVIIIIMLIVYIVLLSQSPVSSNIVQRDNVRNTDENEHIVNEEVTNLDLIISVWGFILGLFISSFVTRFVFREYSSNITIITVTFFCSLLLLILYYIGSNYQNKHINNNWIRYNQIIFPLIGGLFLISEDAINHLFEYFGGNQNRYTDLNINKLAGGIIEIRNALAKNNILSDTSTDYKGSSSEILTDYFTSET